MANFKKSMDILFTLELSSPANALHKNATEDGLTYCGIYESAQPNWEGWRLIRETISRCSLKEASKICYSNECLKNLVFEFYRLNFWEKMRLDEINSQKIADELFIFAVNAGVKRAVKKAQSIVNTEVDGKIGNQTIKALNAYDEKKFDKVFDEEETKYYQAIIDKNPQKRIFANGWINRAKAV